jgi:hypothetical protein
MPALPPIENLESAGLHPNIISAYNVCLDFESWATTDQSRIRARVLGYLIIHAPSVAAAHEVVNVIHSCAHEFQDLSDLGDTFIDYFIRLCKFFFSIQHYPSTPTSRPVKKIEGRTPASSDHPSRPSFDQVKRELKDGIREAPKDHREAKCQVSGYLIYEGP